MTESINVLNTEIDYTDSLLAQCRKDSRAYQALTTLFKQLKQEKIDIENAKLRKEQLDMDSVDIDMNENKNSQLSNVSSAISGTKPQAIVRPDLHSKFMFTPIKSFGWDQGEYNSPSISIYVTLPGIAKEFSSKVTCEFTENSFDLKVNDLEGKSYRLFKDNLEKNIVPDESKYRVKKDKIVIILRKVKGSYSYETWMNLQAKASSSKKEGKGGNASKDNPMGGIMDLMKDMYQDGDDNMKKIIGEAMMKAQTGEKSPGLGDLGGGLGGMGDMGDL